MRILYVCTANICRSASAAHLLRVAVAGAPALAEIEVRSAGTAAMAGSPGCSVAPALVGHAAEHRSQLLTADLVAWADLILPAARDHRPAILALDPRSRTCTFTIRQAGRIADWIVDSGMVAAARERAAWSGEALGQGSGRDAAEALGQGTGQAGAGAGPQPSTRPASAEALAAWPERFPPGDPRREVPVLPADPAGRWLWTVREMDAARGLAGAPREARVEAAPIEHGWRARVRRGGRSTDGETAPHVRPRELRVGGGRDLDRNDAHPDDIPDPHVLGMGLHQLAYGQVVSSTDALVRLLREVVPRD